MKTAIFLGAGAAAADKAPLQGELFRAYFDSLRVSRTCPGYIHHNSDRELVTFFQLMFNIDLDNDDLGAVTFPTFEEVLGVLDLAITREESFRDFDLVNAASNSGRILSVRLYLIILMAKALRDALADTTGSTLHGQLVTNLRAAALLNKVSFFTTNYDLLFDNAILENVGYPDGAAPINYAVDFEDPPVWTKISSSAVRL